MKKATKKDYLYLAALTAAIIFLIVVFTDCGKYLFGSTTDWECQHITLPDYFRNLFYDSGKLFPSLALNLGAGQNIFYFAYYGLFSPFILLSYLLPWVDMTTFIVIISIFSAWLSVMLFYIYRRRNGDREENALLLSALFLFSSPFLFHSHRHVMFVLYFPFLIGAYFGVERYLKSKRFGLLVICSVLIIFTSYFYSPTALISIFILALYRYLHINKNEKFNFKHFTVFALKIAGFLFLAVAIAAILLLPTAYVILHSRGAGTSGDAFQLQYFLPEVRVSNLLYSPYSLGMCSIVLFAIISNFFSKRKELIFLSSFFALMFFFPAVNYITNGLLYFNGKTFIPFVPLCLIMLGGFFRTYFRDFKMKKNALFVFALILVSALISSLFLDDRSGSLLTFFAIDIVLTFVFLILTTVFRKRRFLISFLIIFSMAVCIVVNVNFDEFVSRENYENYTSDDIAALEEIVAEKNDGLYRMTDNLWELYHVNHVSSASLYKTTMYSSTFNRGYNDLYYRTLGNEISHRNSSITNPTANLLSNMILSNKYIIAKNTPCVGYTEIARSGDYALYENKNVLPFAYMSDKTISTETFSALEYPFTSEALTKYIVTDDSEGECDLSTVRADINIKSAEYPDTVSYKGDIKSEFTLTAKKSSRATVKLNNDKHNIVFLRIKLDTAEEEWNGDRSITVNGIKNKITERGAVYHNKNYIFDYVISAADPVDTLDIQITEGVYKITGVELYYLDYGDVSGIAENVTPLNIDNDKTKGDNIVGTINAEKDGKLLFTLPYDEGYTFTVDGKEVEYEKANSTFTAIDVPAGEHTIEVSFRAPWMNIGAAVSVAGIVIFAALMTFGAIKRKKDKQKSSASNGN